MREIRIYGALAKFLGQRVFRADISSVAEAVRFLVCNFPELEQHMIEQHYRVKAGRRFIGEEDLHDPVGREVITIAPVIVGAGPAVLLIGGAALIGLSFAPAVAAVVGAVGASLMLSVGASLFLSGVSSLLTPTPKVSGPGVTSGSLQSQSDQGDPRKNYNFSGVQNTSRQGAPVPVVYGERLVGSVVISAGIDIVQVSA